MSPTARSLDELRKRGYTAQVVEQTINARRPGRPPLVFKRDLYGFGDILAVKADEPGSLIVQACRNLGSGRPAGEGAEHGGCRPLAGGGESGGRLGMGAPRATRRAKNLDAERDADHGRVAGRPELGGAAGNPVTLRRAQPSESREVREWIMKHHYTRAAPPGYRVALEFVDAGERVGAMLLGWPTSRQLDAMRWLELTRMYFVDAAPPNTESHALSMMRRFVRVWFPEVKGLLAYSDPSIGHVGTIYLADGWAPFGLTRNSKVSWRTRPGRRAELPSRKCRWVRSP
jgi:hypothetical protein